MSADAKNQDDTKPKPEATTPKSEATNTTPGATAAAPQTATQEVIDDARHAAQGLRSSALWVGTALAAIPSIALVGTLLKPPDGTSFTPWMLAVGVLLATGGALLGILALATVNKPVAIEDYQLDGFRMTRIVEAVDNDYDTLLERIRRTNQAVADAATRAVDLHLRADLATAALTTATALAEKLQALAKGSNSSTAHDDANAARDALSAASAAAGQAAGLAAAADRMRDHTEKQLAAALSIRKSVFSLVATDVVSRRYNDALGGVAVAAVAVAAGVALIVLSPAKKEEEKPATLSDLEPITLTLTETGKKKVCDTDEPITALRLTADKEEPTVITFPTTGCASKKLTLRVKKPKADAELVEPPAE